MHIIQIDTGAQCNVIPASISKAVGNVCRGKKGSRFVSYSGHEIKTLGIGQEWCDSWVQRKILRDWVSGGWRRCHTSIRAANRHWPSVNTEIIYRGIKRYTGDQSRNTQYLICRSVQRHWNTSRWIYEIKIDESATPVVHPPRRIPYMLKDKIKAELCRMEDMGIITKAEQPNEWVNPIVVVRKPHGDVRMCPLPVDLNKAVKREHYPLKTVEEVGALVCQKHTRPSWPKKFHGLLRSTHPLAAFNLRGCHLVCYQPQRFFKGPCLKCLRTLRNVKLLLMIC